MPIPPYQTFGLNQGLEAGLQRNRDYWTRRLAADRLEQERKQADAANALGQGQLGLGYAELGEKSAGRLSDEEIRRGQLGLSTRAQGETERSNRAGEGLTGQRVGIDAYTAMQQAAENARRFSLDSTRYRSADELAQRAQTETERGNLVGERQKGQTISLQARAQQETERAARQQESFEGRKLTESERENLFRDTFSQMQLEEQKRGNLATESLGQAQLGETGRSNRQSEDFRNRQLAQSGQEFGAELGLKTRAQAEAEAENARMGGYRQQQLAQNESQFGRTLGLDERKQGEQERAAQVGEGQRARELSQRDSELQLKTFQTNLENAVNNRKLDIETARMMNDKAAELSRQGIDIYKHLNELRQRQVEFNANAPLRGAQAESLLAGAEDNRAQAATRGQLADAQAFSQYASGENALANAAGELTADQRIQQNAYNQNQEWLRSGNAPRDVRRQSQEYQDDMYQAQLQNWVKVASRSGDSKAMADLAKQHAALTNSLRGLTQTDILGKKTYRPGAENVIAQIRQVEAQMANITPGYNPSASTESQPTTASSSSAQDLTQRLMNGNLEEVKQIATNHRDPTIRAEALRVYNWRTNNNATPATPSVAPSGFNFGQGTEA